MTPDPLKPFFTRGKKHVLAVPVHDIQLRFYCDQKPLLARLRQCLGHCFGLPRAGARRETAGCSITILNERDYRRVRALQKNRRRFEAFPNAATTFGEIGRRGVYEIKACCLIILDDKTNDCACLLLRRSSDRKLLQLDYVLHVLLIEWLRSRGLYFIHAAAVCRGDRAYLFVGPSGAGKTTAALLGIRRGLSFLGDDRLILKARGDGVAAYAVVENMKVRLDTARQFAELRRSALGREKKTPLRFDVRRRFAVDVGEKAQVRRLFFLNKGNALKKIGPREALRLLMNSSFFCGWKSASAEHFEILCRLASSAQCCRLGRGYLNRRFDELVEMPE